MPLGRLDLGPSKVMIWILRQPDGGPHPLKPQRPSSAFREALRGSGESYRSDGTPLRIIWGNIEDIDQGHGRRQDTSCGFLM